MKIVYTVFLLFLILSTAKSQELFLVSKGNVEFTSDAPLELIQAKSDQVTGLIKTSDRSFAFRAMINSFEGFNSSLQKTHFNENYMESAKYPYTVFEGKIIEEIDFNTPGTYNVLG
jgi:hypothetical protein